MIAQLSSFQSRNSPLRVSLVEFIINLTLEGLKQLA